MNSSNGMLAIHSSAMNSSSACYHEFLLHYKADGKIVYGIVEGKDDPAFYRGFIEQNLPEHWSVELIPAGNKEAVLNSISDFDWKRFKKEQICFFIDRDLSDFTGGHAISADNLYVTDHYSIENACIKFSLFDRVLREVFNLSKIDHAGHAQIKNTFEANVLVFKQVLTPLMAQILIWKRNGVAVCLNDLQLKNLFSFSNGVMQRHANFLTDDSCIQYMATALGATASSSMDRRIVENEFNLKQGADKYIRGKYWFWFLLENAIQIHQSANFYCADYTCPPKLKISIGPKNAMIVIGPRVRCPESLREFIETNFGTFVKPTTTPGKVGNKSIISNLLFFVRKLFITE